MSVPMASGLSVEDRRTIAGDRLRVQEVGLFGLKVDLAAAWAAGDDAAATAIAGRITAIDAKVAAIAAILADLGDVSD